MEKILAEKLKWFLKKKKIKCFIAKDKRKEKLQYSIAASQCVNFNKVLQQTREENSEKHSKEYVLIESIKDYTVFLYYTLSRRVFLGIHILG